MPTTAISDLDELALTVRDRLSQSYILEAISAYRAGAYRAAIISTWVAVSYDIISKIRELAMLGDTAAAAFESNLNEAIENRAISRLQGIENSILNQARDQFQLLAIHEHDDLDRLYRDRNSCAHPAFVSNDILFQPTPDQVRTHIVHSITHLLCQQPVQGKSARDRIFADIKGNAFPEDEERVIKFLCSKYLDRAKDSLVRSVIAIIVKAIVFDNIPDLPREQYRERFIHTLKALMRRHMPIYEQEMKQKLSLWCANLDDRSTPCLFTLISVDIRCWSWTSEALRFQVSEWLKHNVSSVDYDSDVFGALSVPELSDTILTAIDNLDFDRKVSVLSYNPRAQFADISIKVYKGSRNYRESEQIARSIVLLMAKYFNSDHIIAIIDAVIGNSQNWNAMRTPQYLVELFEATSTHLRRTLTHWKRLLEFVKEMNMGEEYSELEKRLL